MRWIRRYLITGLLVLAPVVITGYILWFGFNVLDSLWRSLLVLALGRAVPGGGALLTVAFTVVVGMVATNVVGRRLIEWGERLLGRIPLVRGVYTTTRQLVDIFAGRRQEGFQRVVLVEYPRRGCYSIGFVTASGHAEASRSAGVDVLPVFVPTAPNPTSGWLAFLPRSECRSVNISVDEAFRLIVSCGVLAGNGAVPPPASGRPAGGPARGPAGSPVTDPATGSS